MIKSEKYIFFRYMFSEGCSLFSQDVAKFLTRKCGGSFAHYNMCSNNLVCLVQEGIISPFMLLEDSVWKYVFCKFLVHGLNEFLSNERLSNLVKINFDMMKIVFGLVGELQVRIQIERAERELPVDVSRDWNDITPYLKAQSKKVRPLKFLARSSIHQILKARPLVDAADAMAHLVGYLPSVLVDYLKFCDFPIDWSKIIKDEEDLGDDHDE